MWTVLQTGRCRRCFLCRDRRWVGCVRPEFVQHGGRSGLKHHPCGPDTGWARVATAWGQGSVCHGSSRQRRPVLDRCSKDGAGRAGKLQPLDSGRGAPINACPRRFGEERGSDAALGGAEEWVQVPEGGKAGLACQVKCVAAVLEATASDATSRDERKEVADLIQRHALQHAKEEVSQIMGRKCASLGVTADAVCIVCRELTEALQAQYDEV